MATEFVEKIEPIAAEEKIHGDLIAQDRELAQIELPVADYFAGGGGAGAGSDASGLSSKASGLG